MNKKIFNSSGKGRSSVILLFTFLIISLGAINCSKDSSPGGNNIPAASTVETPTFSPVAGTYNTDQSITIATATEGALIYYTTDGSAPTSSSTEYTAAISVAGHGTTMTIKAIAAKSGMTDSSVAEAMYTINYDAVAMPTFSPAAGTYNTDQSVTISSITAGSNFYYTTDGSTPACSGTGTAGSTVTVSSAMTIKAIACKSGMTDSSVASAAYTIKRWVSVGDSGTVIYSSDGGDNWALGTATSTTYNLRSVASDGSGRWVAVGSSGTAIYSTDGGDNWTPATTTSTPDFLYGVAYDGSGKWVAVGTSGAAIYSTDGGDNWTPATATNTGSTLLDVASDGSGRWVAVGISGAAIYSTDGGDNWTPATATNTGNHLYGVAYDGSRFVAVGYTGTVIYSTDGGDNWTPATATNTANLLNGVAYDGSRFVAVGASGTVIYSTDGGDNWNPATATNTASILQSVAYDGTSRWVAVGTSGTVIYSSDGGANWSTATDSGVETTNYLRGVAFE